MLRLPFELSLTGTLSQESSLNSSLIGARTDYRIELGSAPCPTARYANFIIISLI